jgi:hypothetical protein
MTASKSALQPISARGTPTFFTSFDGCEAVLVPLRRLKFSALVLSGRPLGDDWQCWAGWKNHRKTKGNVVLNVEAKQLNMLNFIKHHPGNGKNQEQV